MEIVEIKKPRIEGATLIEGFPGIGLVGTIATSYLVEKISMEQIGYIYSEEFPAISAIHNHIPLHPARIYECDKLKFYVLFSEFIVPMSQIYPLAREILKWALTNKVKQIISLGGIVMKGEQDEVYGISSTPEVRKMLEKHGVKSIKEGATTGVSGVLLAECATRGFPAFSLLAESRPEYLDPRAAAMVLDILKRMLDFEIDTSELVHESEAIEAKLKELLEGAKKAHNHYQQVDKIGTMYG
ncbi:MAG: proteasome assembly chaperone family protein [Candidatus Micrarchaeia archaeon]